MLNEVLHLTNGAAIEHWQASKNNDQLYEEFVNYAVASIYKAWGFTLTNTSCFGCKYDDCEVDEEERKSNCLSCLEPVTIRKNFIGREDALHVKDK